MSNLRIRKKRTTHKREKKKKEGEEVRILS